MKDDSDRHYAVLEDTVRVLSKLCLLLDWHIGRPLAKIGSLEIAPLPVTEPPTEVPDGAGFVRGPARPRVPALASGLDTTPSSAARAPHAH